MSDCRKCAEFDWCTENEDCGLFKPKSQTNADRIRSMTDEELAEFLNGKNFCARNFDCEKRPCRDCNLGWLKQEADG